MDLFERVILAAQNIRQRFDKLTDLISYPEVSADNRLLRRLCEERDSIQAIVDALIEFEEAREALAHFKGELKGEADQESREAIMELVREGEKREGELFNRLNTLLVDRKREMSGVLIEIIAKTNEPSQLFAQKILDMYAAYASQMGFDLEVESVEKSKKRVLTLSIEGMGAHRLLYENGVHLAQSGEEVSVIVTQKAEEYSIEELNPKDLRIDIFHSGGAGGQHINKVATAVRITHLPSGIVVVCQDMRSQLKNKEQAIRTLTERLNKKQKEEIEEKQRAQKQNAISAAKERVRTYDFSRQTAFDQKTQTTFGLKELFSGALKEVFDVAALKGLL